MRKSLSHARFGQHRRAIEGLEDRRLLAHNILIAAGGSASIPSGATSFSDNGACTTSPTAFASLTGDVDLQASSVATSQDPTNVSSGKNLIVATNQAIALNKSLSTPTGNLTFSAGIGEIQVGTNGQILATGVVTTLAGSAGQSPAVDVHEWADAGIRFFTAAATPYPGSDHVRLQAGLATVADSMASATDCRSTRALPHQYHPPEITVVAVP